MAKMIQMRKRTARMLIMDLREVAMAFLRLWMAGNMLRTLSGLR